MMTREDLNNIISRLQDFGQECTVSITEADQDQTKKTVRIEIETSMNKKDFSKFQQFADAIERTPRDIFIDCFGKDIFKYQNEKV